MKKPGLILLLFFVQLSVFAQKEGKPIYMNLNWEQCAKKHASYYRIIEKQGTIYTVVDYYLNGQIQMTGQFFNKATEERTGDFKYYDSLGRMEQLTHYRENRRHGSSVTYYPGGQVKLTKDYEDDHLHGEYKEYYENGAMRAEAQFVHGKLRGEAKRYGISGGLVLEMEIDKEGSGASRAFYVNGQPREEATFTEGFRSGNWKLYREDGSLETEKTYSELEDFNRLKRAKPDAEPYESVGSHFLLGYDFGTEEETGRAYFPDVEASFPGGTQRMQTYISNNVQYPAKAIIRNIQGRVYMTFVVEPDGSITNIQMEAGHKVFEKESKRLIENMPPWIPGELRGKKARTRCRLPINFTLN
jgi:TonB family protein